MAASSTSAAHNVTANTGKLIEKRRRHRPLSLLWEIFASAASVGDAGSCNYSGSIAGNSVPTARIERLESLKLCFKGFARDDRPSLQFLNGSRTAWNGRGDINEPRARTWSWNSAQMAALFPQPGVYRFVVTMAGAKVAGGRVLVQPATAPEATFSYQGRPASCLTSSNRLRPGETLSVTAVGYKPGTPIFASLYGDEHNDRDRLRLLTDLAPVTANRHGEGVLRWTATSADRTGSRVVLVEPAASGRSPCSENRNRCSKFRIVP